MISRAAYVRKTWKSYEDNILLDTSVSQFTYTEDGSYSEEATYYDADGTVIGTDTYLLISPLPVPCACSV